MTWPGIFPHWSREPTGGQVLFFLEQGPIGRRLFAASTTNEAAGTISRFHVGWSILSNARGPPVRPRDSRELRAATRASISSIHRDRVPSSFVSPASMCELCFLSLSLSLALSLSLSAHDYVEKCNR